MSERNVNIDHRIGCDACVAKALYCIRFSFGCLFLCGHHWAEYERSINNHSQFLETSLLDGTVLLAKLILCD
jgi:hypothetical protein